MKAKLLIALLIVFVLSSCGTTRKIQSVETISDKRTTEAERTTSTFVDTTKTSTGVISIVEVTFFGDFPEIVSDESDSIPTGEPRASPPAKSTIGVNGISISGDIQSAKITSISNKTTEKGLTASDSTYTSSEDRLTDTSSKSAEEPKDPYRWKWIFGISVVALIGIAYLISLIKKSNIWEVIKKALSL